MVKDELNDAVKKINALEDKNSDLKRQLREETDLLKTAQRKTSTDELRAESEIAKYKFDAWKSVLMRGITVFGIVVVGFSYNIDITQIIRIFMGV